jgi:hypothetical protein
MTDLLDDFLDDEEERSEPSEVFVTEAKAQATVDPVESSELSELLPPVICVSSIETARRIVSRCCSLMWLGDASIITTTSDSIVEFHKRLESILQGFPQLVRDWGINTQEARLARRYRELKARKKRLISVNERMRTTTNRIEAQLLRMTLRESQERTRSDEVNRPVEFGQLRNAIDRIKTSHVELAGLQAENERLRNQLNARLEGSRAGNLLKEELSLSELVADRCGTLRTAGVANASLSDEVDAVMRRLADIERRIVQIAPRTPLKDPEAGPAVPLDGSVPRLGRRPSIKAQLVPSVVRPSFRRAGSDVRRVPESKRPRRSS